MHSDVYFQHSLCRLLFKTFFFFFIIFTSFYYSEFPHKTFKEKHGMHTPYTCWNRCTADPSRISSQTVHLWIHDISSKCNLSKKTFRLKTFRLNAFRLKEISSNTIFRLKLSKFRLKVRLKIKRKESDGTLFVRHVFQQNRLQAVASSRGSARGAITVPVQFPEARKAERNAWSDWQKLPLHAK